MPKLNENYQNLEESYLFAEIARRVKVYEEDRRCDKAADKEGDRYTPRGSG